MPLSPFHPELNLNEAHSCMFLVQHEHGCKVNHSALNKKFRDARPTGRMSNAKVLFYKVGCAHPGVEEQDPTGAASGRQQGTQWPGARASVGVHVGELGPRLPSADDGQGAGVVAIWPVGRLPVRAISHLHGTALSEHLLRTSTWLCCSKK